MALRRRPAREEAPIVLEARIEGTVGELPEGKRLGEVIVDLGLAGPEEIQQAVATQAATAKRLGTALVDRGTISERDLAAAIARRFDLALVDLRTVTPQREATALLDETVAHELNILPIELDSGEAVVALSDPLDPKVLNALRRMPVAVVKPVIAPANELRAAINVAYRALQDVDQQVTAFAETGALQPPAVDRERQEMAGTGDAPIIQLVNKVVTQARRDRASDVHIEPMDDRIRVRYRIDGALKEVLSLPSGMGPALVSRIKIMADMNIVERRKPQDGQFAITVDGRELDVRVSSTATIYGEKVVLRLLDKSRSLMELDKLGMPADTEELYKRLVRTPYGMVLCSGPTGSGKTTTLYATLGEIANDELNVVTIEDPVEYVFPGINQMPVNPQGGLTFASGLRSILRQDPDIILVGEIRDAETARIAVQAALTGHRVLSSVHATDAASTIVRLLDMGIEPFLVSSAVLGAVAQRLVRVNCRSCMEPYEPSTEELAFFHDVWMGDEDPVFKKGAGCSLCSNTGYLGRIGVYEVMPMTDEIRELIVSGTTPHEVRSIAIKHGMRTMRDEGVRLVAEGRTTVEEIIKSIYVM